MTPMPCWARVLSQRGDGRGLPTPDVLIFTEVQYSKDAASFVSFLVKSSMGGGAFLL